ncbi:class I SAM-dependent methyltransferase [Aetokthonos hydrillicola Thurmond2011]|jgi:SAM-dependent methyltransferase|uniref:Class I SAM-dependent methyltransferase n=1 Tax=Aetokthonos hydrillicola Thurmond2011 TaxID=2712845 RepID=A0AAP5MDM6_9CYAN|nr:class I SAM-dependent methyltransferase [Aetokthonos hydrillicola]MBO3460074.1 class I SAM-dependent methyltransferase [Aetokthonos hydrillicola CCALA 1050]MBW4589527.1 class I SAM-dependent methyltransferase [Aetokthonos hydrillicola CCALA 1050]MDR9899823.1 class I SAM-dependent methyltransferase [Aetokthonos hydrillicola Thurmond2011]
MQTNQKENIRQYYIGERGTNYHAARHSRDPYVQEVVARERTRKLQPLFKADDTVLEFGVGTGLNLLYLQCQRRVGYDVSIAGREICTSAGIEFINDNTSLTGQQFSVVLCHHVLEHVPDPYDCLEEIWQLLQPGGKLILCVPFEIDRRYRHFYTGDLNQHLFSWNALTLGNLVSSIGFSVNSAKVHPFGYEQRLAFLAKYGLSTYHLGLWVIRKLIPADEILLIATKNE